MASGPGSTRAATTRATFATAARDAVALMGTSMRHTPISRRIMQTSQRLRIVAKYTVGVDDIDTEAATDLGIMVCHAPTESNCFGVAEQTIAFMLALLKKIRERDANVRAGKWRLPEDATTFLGRRESDGHPGITIGLVGLGRIGTRVAQLLAPWRVRILAYDPYIPPANFLLAGVKSVDYPTLLKESDVVSFHVVLTKGDPLHVRRARDRADEAERHRAQHRPRQGDRRGGAGAGARRRDGSAPPRSARFEESRRRRTHRCARWATRS